MFDPDDKISVFRPEPLEEKEFRDRKIQLEKNLREIRKMIWVAIIGFFFLLWLFSQNGRYSHNNEGTLIIDTRTGAVYDYQGDWLGNQAKGTKSTKLVRVSMGFWPYWGYWKVETMPK
ncbi:MAG: hypothetical protein C0433_14410 [Cyclobacterium sp.]|nr:hypothetical protein [Cyclobacterium sp.]